MGWGIIEVLPPTLNSFQTNLEISILREQVSSTCEIGEFGERLGQTVVWVGRWVGGGGEGLHDPVFYLTSTPMVITA